MVDTRSMYGRQTHKQTDNHTGFCVCVCTHFVYLYVCICVSIQLYNAAVYNITCVYLIDFKFYLWVYMMVWWWRRRIGGVVTSTRIIPRNKTTAKLKTISPAAEETQSKQWGKSQILHPTKSHTHTNNQKSRIRINEENKEVCSSDIVGVGQVQNAGK